MNSQRLAGKVAIITGGSRGIGKGIAERFVAEGACVVLAAYNDDEQMQQTVSELCERYPVIGQCAVGFDTNVADTEAVVKLFEFALCAYPQVDILVNNAGIQAVTTGADFDPAVMKRILDVNLYGPAICSREAIRHFLSRPGGGCIVNNTSVHQVIPKPTYSAYAMSKAAVGHLTRTLALEYADKGIRVNAVGPGAIITDINAAWKDNPKAKANVERHIPMGYAATPDQISAVFAFLASDEAMYMTGQTLFVDGGLTLYGEFKENWSS